MNSKQRTEEERKQKAEQRSAYWFKHDYNASGDDKLLDIRSELGFEGLGLYWWLVEQAFDSKGKLKERKVKSLCKLNGIDLEKVEVVLKYGFKKSTDEDNETYYTSDRIALEVDSKEDNINNARKAANKRWENYHKAQEAKEKKEAAKTKVNVKTGEISKPKASGQTLREVDIQELFNAVYDRK